MMTKTRFSIKFLPELRFYGFFFLPKSTFWEILIKIEMLKNVDKNQTFRNIDQNRDFLIILSKIETFENFDQNEVIQKFRLKSTFSKILPQMEIFQSFWLIWRSFRKLWPKSRFFDYILGKSWFIQKFLTISRLSKIVTKFRIIKNFEIWHNFRNFWQKSRFSKVRKLKPRFFENFDQCEDFQKNLKEFNVFQKFWPKSTFSKILTKSKNFMNFDQNQHFRKFWQKSRWFTTIFDKIRWFENLCQNQVCLKINREFQEFWP